LEHFSSRSVPESHGGIGEKGERVLRMNEPFDQEQEQDKPQLMGLTQADVTKILEGNRRRARVIHREEQTLESEVVSENKQVSSDKKYVVETQVITTTTKYVTVREYDPDANYSDTLDEFMNKE
jgi:hypothetical protein